MVVSVAEVFNYRVFSAQ